jgi:hypothetical protein
MVEPSTSCRASTLQGDVGVLHPLDRVPAGRLRRWQIPSVLIAGACLASLPLILPGRESHTLLDLVESGSAAAAAGVLDQWTPSDRVRVAYAVGLDFLMNPAYLNGLAIAAVWAGRVIRLPAAPMMGSWLAWFAWSSALTNVFENVGIFRLLVVGPTDPWPVVIKCAHYWATGAIACCLLFSAAGVMARLRHGSGDRHS